MKRLSPIFLFIFIISACQMDKKETDEATQVSPQEYALNNPPKWAENQIWYQIFVERFYNADESNDPTAEDIVGAWPYEAPADWEVTPWTHDWYAKEDWSAKNGRTFYDNTQLRRYGGDLQGVISKLDYLQDLGVTAIYLNPINHAPSLHKYDAASYHHVDASFGPNPEKDKETMATEIGDDPNTWQWTEADKLFLHLVEEVHKRDMKIILDFSWNHTGLDFWTWKDVVEKQEKSKYADWYMIKSFNNPETEEDEFDYEGWLGFKSLPELKKVDVVNRHHGKPYEGNVLPAVKQHIFDVTKRWLAPNGEVSKGIDGIRLDVADQIPMGFWKEYRQYVKSINPEAYLVGEIWWEAFPDKLMNPRPYLGEPAFDAVMYYQVYRPARGFFGVNDNAQDAPAFVNNLQAEWKDIPDNYLRAMMGLNASHDTPRLLTSMDNKPIYKRECKPNENHEYNAGQPKPESYLRTKLYLMHQFTSLSSPHIWNGDEMGMWGADDPDCRKPLWWPEYKFDNESSDEWQQEPKSYEVGFNQAHYEFYKELIKLRKSHAALHSGRLNFTMAEGDLLSYVRTHKGDRCLVMFNLSEKNHRFAGNKELTDILFTVGHQSTVYDDSSVEVPPMSGVVIGKSIKE